MRIQDKNHMVVSRDAEKSIWQNSTPIHNKNSQQTKVGRKLIKHIQQGHKKYVQQYHKILNQ